MDLDPQVAADQYRARVIGPYRGVLPEAEVTALEEKLAGACTVEVAAFDTFARLLADPALVGAYDHVIFDTAPTGHTLRLLRLPAAWSDYLGANPDATSCLGPLGGVQDHRPTYAAAVDTLRDSNQATVVLVARPDVRAFAVAVTAATELRELGIDHQTLVVNGVLAQPLAGDQVAESYAAEQQASLKQLPAPLDQMNAAMVPLVATDLIGVAALRQITTTPTTTPVATSAPRPVADAVRCHAGRACRRTRNRGTWRHPGDRQGRSWQDDRRAAARRRTRRDAVTPSICQRPTPPDAHRQSTPTLPTSRRALSTPKP